MWARICGGRAGGGPGREGGEAGGHVAHGLAAAVGQGGQGVAQAARDRRGLPCALDASAGRGEMTRGAATRRGASRGLEPSVSPGSGAEAGRRRPDPGRARRRGHPSAGGAGHRDRARAPLAAPEPSRGLEGVELLRLLGGELRPHARTEGLARRLHLLAVLLHRQGRLAHRRGVGLVRSRGPRAASGAARVPRRAAARPPSDARRASS